jgi:outer membrane protein assembly factor BamB
VIHPALSLSLLASAALARGGSSSEAPQWAGFRGNNGCGLSSTAGLPDVLDPETNLIWRVAVPAGYSSPAIAGKHLFLTGVRETAQGRDVSGKLVTTCLDAYSGEPRWERELDYRGARPGGNSSAAPSPATDGEVVVALFHHFGLVAFDLEGKELWRQPIGPFNIPHGMATSPVLHGELVLLQVDQDEDAYLVAYERKTGKERWKVARPGVTHSYATPAIWQPAGGAAQLVVSGSFQVTGYSLEKGEKLWWMDGAAWQSKSVPLFANGRCYVNSFMPSLSELQMPSFEGTFEEVLAEHDANGDGKIAKSEYGEAQLHQVWFIFDLDGDDVMDAEEWEYALKSNDATGGLYAIELGKSGALASTWKFTDRRGLSDVTTPVIVGDALYVVSEGGLLTALDLASGKVRKQERVGQPDQYFASPVAGDGKLYLASLSGILTVVATSPGADWKELGSHALEDEEVWASPALAGKAVYVRCKEALYCFEDPE